MTSFWELFTKWCNSVFTLHRKLKYSHVVIKIQFLKIWKILTFKYFVRVPFSLWRRAFRNLFYSLFYKHSVIDGVSYFVLNRSKSSIVWILNWRRHEYCSVSIIEFQICIRSKWNSVHGCMDWRLKDVHFICAEYFCYKFSTANRNHCLLLRKYMEIYSVSRRWGKTRKHRVDTRETSCKGFWILYFILLFLLYSTCSFVPYWH